MSIAKRYKDSTQHFNELITNFWLLATKCRA